ncbi:DUF4087 domain-containing protein [Sphingomonas sp. BIUV-7]|uniref:DUF4087 domain-containing protein n=1 Tax=Sphingomonas natans TaxID=3063330 RepID=A0ABT8Y7T9_9SPHN|nr:DUF4087 domain-containing protein [Sphingomonas sp. BIUV-7]MDO6414381.1 DUF4087 domain-containing protein [Sphingomonas sp. BIUV-7]
MSIIDLARPRYFQLARRSRDAVMKLISACSIGAALSFLAWSAMPARASSAKLAPTLETRCGWFVNVTPGNFELDDAQGQWTLAQQGGYQAEGLDALPDMSAKGWVAINGPHGHSCACMTVSVDRSTMLVTHFYAARPVPLERCRADRRLPKP